MQTKNKMHINWIRCWSVEVFEVESLLSLLLSQ